MKKTKIVSTLGPATDSKEMIEKLVDAGVNCFRLNFSHGNREEKEEILERIRNVSDEVAVFADTQGPEIRLNPVEEGTEIEGGETVLLTDTDEEGNAEKLSVDYDELIEYLSEGDDVLIDDGKLELRVEEVREDEAECLVVHGGEVKSRKSVNVPGKDIGLQAPTEKDQKDIEFAAKHDFDYISLSFVKAARDVEATREILEEHDSDAGIISKIEHLKALDNYDEILEVTDGIMVARGDLGVEAEASELPLLQKEQIRKANRAGKPVVTATQMLESMTENPMPTRAEISDVANAVMDGTDAVMLSGETAVGDYPVETVSMMAEICEQVEDTEEIDKIREEETSEKTEIIGNCLVHGAEQFGADDMIVPTTSGLTARNASKFRPEANILAFTNNKRVKRRLALVWGVKAIYEEFPEHVEVMINSFVQEAIDQGLIDMKDNLAISAGAPDTSGATNMLQLGVAQEFLQN